MIIWSAEIKELETLHPFIKGRFPELEKDLEHLIKTDDENVALLYSRRCLEIIITDLCECELKRDRGTEPLKGIIDKLSHEKKVPFNIIASMEGLNTLSTFGTHPKDFEPEQVKPVLSNLAIIIKWFIKYKDTYQVEEEKPGKSEHISKMPEAVLDNKAGKSKRKLIFILSGLFLVIIIIVGALFIFNVIGEKEQGQSDTGLAKSIAVIPFKNYSNDPGQEYMSDGLTDEIISHLFKIASFDKVVSLSTMLTYKGTEKQLPLIADELKVNYILEGTYKKIGDQVRVTAQLIEPKNDKHIWLNTYDRPYKEIIDIQSDIALQIAEQLNAFLTDSEKQNIQKIPTTNQAAYELVKQAEIHFYTGIETYGDQFFKIGKDLALQAIELDPDYAQAYAIAGMFYFYDGAYAGNKEMSEATLEALPYIEKALELDPGNARAHMIMGSINEWSRWDYVRAEKEYMRSIELEPNNIGGNLFITTEFFIKMNRPERAQIYIEKYVEYTENVATPSFMDPAGLLIKLSILSGNKKEAYNWITSYFGPDKEKPNAGLGDCYIWLGEYDSAKLIFDTFLHSDDSSYVLSIPRFLSCRAFTYYKTKNYPQARDIINQLITRTNITSAGSPEYYIGWYYSGIGEVDSAFYWLEKAYKKRSAEMSWLKVNPVFKNLMNDDRYWDLYERTGHKAYDEYLKEMKK
jgi:TolB-like protein